MEGWKLNQSCSFISIVHNLQNFTLQRKEKEKEKEKKL